MLDIRFLYITVVSGDAGIFVTLIYHLKNNWHGLSRALFYGESLKGTLKVKKAVQINNKLTNSPVLLCPTFR